MVTEPTYFPMWDIILQPGDTVFFGTRAIFVMIAFLIYWLGMIVFTQRLGKFKLFRVEAFGLALWAYLVGFVLIVVSSNHRINHLALIAQALFLLIRSRKAKYGWGQSILIAVGAVLISLWILFDLAWRMYIY